MNGWLLFILTVIAVTWLADTAVSLLNLKALSPHLPNEFADSCSEEEYRRSQAYTRARTRFSLVEKTVTTLVTVVFIVVGGFNSVDVLVRAAGLNSIGTGILYAGVLGLLAFLAGLPFTVYDTFIIEARFGFNRTTVATFLADLLKSLLLAAVLGAPVLAALIWFFENTGHYGWLLCWLAGVAFSLVVHFLAPVLIMPLFNKFTPLAEGPLKEKILDYAARQDFRIGGIFTMDGSKRSGKLNAFFTGFGRFRKIVFFDTLLDKIDDDQIVSVLAHEMGHFKKHHIWKMMALSFLQTGLIFYLLSLILNNPGLFQAFRMESVSTYASLFFFAFLYTPISALISLLVNGLSRTHEFEADRFAGLTTGSPELLMQALKQLSLANLSNLTPHPAMVFWSYSHPPVLERIKALRNLHDRMNVR